MLGALWPNPWPPKKWLQIDGPAKHWAISSQLYNLELNDETLVADFKKHINHLREQAGVERPTPGKGVRRKSLPWRVIELMDLRYFHHEALNAGERSQVSKARIQCEQFCSEANLILKKSS